YLFKDKDDVIIYIGKAIDLKKRVSSYFLKTSYNDPYYEDKIKRLVERINSIEYMVTENEKEALILENILIKKHHPRFNVFMRDSKSYPWVCISYSEKFPRVRIIRNPQHYSSGNLFLGPYTDKKDLQRILRDLRKIFPYCSCKRKIKERKRPCLYYQLKLCPGPCIGAVSEEDYLENIRKIELFLKGETQELKEQIKIKMEKSAKSQEYEQAAFWRDKLKAIKNTTTNQHVLLEEEIDKDIIGYYISNDYVTLIIIHIRDGRMTNKSPFTINLREKVIQKENILPSLVQQYYQDMQFNLPDIIVIPEKFQEVDLITEVLKESKENIVIRMSDDEHETGLTRIANKNAKVIVNQKEQIDEIKAKEEEEKEVILKNAQDLLQLPSIPYIIEGFDISNIEGTNPTGSMVYFYKGEPDKENYRHYNIRLKETPDDVGMMKEVISRRYRSLLKRDKELPDLILVDGGKGQVNAASSIIDNLNLDIPIIGLAKKDEEIFVPDRKKPIILHKNSSVLKIFQHIRDEAHRFALNLHKKRRKKGITGSILEEIKGVGPATRNKLLKIFGSLKGVRAASLEEISESVGEKLAKKIKQKFP
ncbi:MAG: excinuclease ABC subunit UvrC, partial [Promethearchaeia archaeon]